MCGATTATTHGGDRLTGGPPPLVYLAERLARASAPRRGSAAIAPCRRQRITGPKRLPLFCAQTVLFPAACCRSIFEHVLEMTKDACATARFRRLLIREGRKSVRPRRRGPGCLLVLAVDIAATRGAALIAQGRALSRTRHGGRAVWPHPCRHRDSRRERRCPRRSSSVSCGSSQRIVAEHGEGCSPSPSFRFEARGSARALAEVLPSRPRPSRSCSSWTTACSAWRSAAAAGGNALLAKVHGPDGSGKS